MNGQFLHTMLRVFDLDRSTAFYAGLLGMKELRRREVPDGRYTLVFMGYASNAEGQAEIELTYNWDQTAPYELWARRSGIWPLACPTWPLRATQVRDGGGRVVREAGPVQFGTTVIAFVEDPDGYKIELIEKK